MSSSDERAAFEEWAQENAYDLTPSEANERGYWYGSTAIAWAAWQARATPSRADGADVLVREIAALKRYDANAKKGWNREGPSKFTVNLPVDLSERIDAFMEARATVSQATVTGDERADDDVSIADFLELIDAYQCAQKDGTHDERAKARIALMNAYHAALARAAVPHPGASNDAAIAACTLMIKGICMTHPQDQWSRMIEERIRFMLATSQA